MLLDGLSTGQPCDRSQRPDHQDGVVRVADHWDEVGHEVDGHGEVGQQQPETEAQPGRQARVPSQTGSETKNIGKDTQSVAQATLIWLDAPQNDQQAHPQQEQTRRNSCDRSPHHAAQPGTGSVASGALLAAAR